jgi:hypothetical protein
MGIAAATEAMATALFSWAELRASLEPYSRGATKSVTGQSTETVLLLVRRELLLGQNAAAGN